MMEDRLTENVTIDDKAAHQIAVAHNQYKIISIGFIISSAGSIVLMMNRYLRYKDKPFYRWEDIVNFRIYSFISILEVAILAFQLYFTFNAVSFQKKALDLNDKDLFNKSFGFYARGNRLGIATMIINIVMVYLYIWQEII